MPRYSMRFRDLKNHQSKHVLKRECRQLLRANLKANSSFGTQCRSLYKRNWSGRLSEELTSRTSRLLFHTVNSQCRWAIQFPSFKTRQHPRPRRANSRAWHSRLHKIRYAELNQTCRRYMNIRTGSRWNAYKLSTPKSRNGKTFKNMKTL